MKWFWSFLLWLWPLLALGLLMFMQKIDAGQAALVLAVVVYSAHWNGRKR